MWLKSATYVSAYGWCFFSAASRRSVSAAGLCFASAASAGGVVVYCYVVVWCSGAVVQWCVALVLVKVAAEWKESVKENAENIFVAGLYKAAAGRSRERKVRSE